jgi:acetaldehyde dehydrogenase (acetylating)
MRQRSVGVILATGGTGLVRAAYSSGKPAYGVGPGNVPRLSSAPLTCPKPIADIFAGKTFDYGTICSSEQAIVVEERSRIWPSPNALARARTGSPPTKFAASARW